jgi:hypothetical protein
MLAIVEVVLRLYHQAARKGRKEEGRKRRGREVALFL